MVSAAVIVFYYIHRSARIISPLIPEHVLRTISKTPGTLIIHSESFMNATSMPSKYAYCGKDDYSLSIVVENTSVNTESIILVMYDPDTPSRLSYHWVVYGLKCSREVLAGESSRNIALLQCNNNYGFQGTVGRARFQEIKPHRYIFLAIAVDIDSGTWPPSLSPENILARIKNHVIASGYIYGTYSRCI